MSAIVFLGPSLSVAEARTILDAEYRPPAAVGDVLAALSRRPDAIGIIDGFFENVPAVWHKEILFALSQGVPVFGSSSMGALRAAELWRFGMVGVGGIFEAYKTGELEDDDEVAIEHASAEDGYRALSDAMVNIRAGLERAHAGGLIGRTTQQNLLALAKSWFYGDRKWERLLSQAHTVGATDEEVQALRAFVRRETPNAKRDDARELLARIAADFGAQGERDDGPRFDFEPTTYWARLVAEVERRQISTALMGGATYSGIRDHLKIEARRDGQLSRESLFFNLVLKEAERLQITVSPEEVEEAARQLVPDWDVSTEVLWAYARLRLLVEKLAMKEIKDATELLPLTLFEREDARDVMSDVCRNWRAFARRTEQSVDGHAAAMPVSDILRLYQRDFGELDVHPRTHAQILGFKSEEDFLLQLVLRFGHKRRALGNQRD